MSAACENKRVRLLEYLAASALLGDIFHPFPLSLRLSFTSHRHVVWVNHTRMVYFSLSTRVAASRPSGDAPGRSMASSSHKKIELTCGVTDARRLSNVAVRDGDESA